MAGDWIKMCKDLLTHPKVMRMVSVINADNRHAASATKSGQMSRNNDDECHAVNVQPMTDRFRIVGGLMSVWCIFDSHSTDGFLQGYTLESLDSLTGWPGFSEAMVAVGWLAVKDGLGLEMPEFDAHNGQSAKKRAIDTRRKKKQRDKNVMEPA